MKEIPLLCFLVIVWREIGCIQDSQNAISIAGMIWDDIQRCYEQHIGELFSRSTVSEFHIVLYLTLLSGDLFLE